MGYSKHVLSSNKHVTLPKTKFVILDMLLHYLHITATLFCPQARVAVKLLRRGSAALFTECGFLEYFLAILLLFTCQTKSLFAKNHHHFPASLSHSLIHIKTETFLVSNSETRTSRSHLRATVCKYRPKSSF